MYMRLFLFLLLYSALSFEHPLFCQNELDSISTGLIRKYEKSPSEIIYIQTSKDIYETGEDLWFKAYQLDSRNHSLSAESKTLYLQVLNDKDSIIWQEKYPIIDGISTGHIYLDEKLKGGIYSIETYTNSSFYNDSLPMSTIRKIKIVDNINVKVEIEKDTISLLPLRFDTFPEGGNLISGIRSQLAFKATDGKGDPMDVSGFLYENDSTIISFKSTHDGMGKLTFMPSQNNRYKIKLSNGQEYPLPHVHPQGLSLHLLSQNNHYIEFMVYSKGRVSSQNIYLLGQIGGYPRCAAKAAIQDSLKIRMPLNDFLIEGIAEFTLFDENMHPVAERLVYVNSGKELKISANLDKKNYKVKNKAQLSIKVTDENDNPVNAHLGVSVFDKAYSDLSYPVNIRTHYLLSTQIKGHIHNPNYYFDKENSNRKEALDLLLMTQGWRRYIWQFNKEQQGTGHPFINDGIEGNITRKKKQINNTEQLLQVFNYNEENSFLWTDSLGNFSIDPEVLHQLRGGYLYVKPLVDKTDKPKLEFEDPFKPINAIRRQKQKYYAHKQTSFINHKPIDRGHLITDSATILLDEVTITGKSRKPLRDKFMGRLDSLAQADILGPWVCDCEKHPQTSYLENYRHGYTHHPFHDYKGKKLPPVNGKAYKIIKYEPIGPNGAWVLTDKQTVIYNGAEYSDEDLLRMNNLWRIKGYYGEREFYMPDDVDMLSSIPDARNTLLWNPSVITDNNGEAELEFYTSDLNTMFIGRIEGVDNNGSLGTSQIEFTVIRNSQTD